MKTYSAQIQYRTPEGELEQPWLLIAARSQKSARAIAKAEAQQRSNGKGAYVTQLSLAYP